MIRFLLCVYCLRSFTHLYRSFTLSSFWLTRNQFSITIKGVSLWNLLNNYVKLSLSLRMSKIKPNKFIMQILTSFKIYKICKLCIV